MCARRRRKRTCKKTITPIPYFATLTTRLPDRDNFIFPARPQTELLKRRKKGEPAPPPRFSNRRDLHMSRSRFGLICKSTSPDWDQKITPAQAAKKKARRCPSVEKPVWVDLDVRTWSKSQTFFPGISKSPEKNPSAPPHQNKNPKFAGFRKCQKLDFSIPRPSQNFPLPTSEDRRNVRRNTQNAKKG